MPACSQLFGAGLGSTARPRPAGLSGPEGAMDGALEPAPIQSQARETWTKEPSVLVSMMRLEFVSQLLRHCFAGSRTVS